MQCPKHSSLCLLLLFTVPWSLHSFRLKLTQLKKMAMSATLMRRTFLSISIRTLSSSSYSSSSSSSSLLSQNNDLIQHAKNATSSSFNQVIIQPSFLAQWHRGFAKAKKSKGDEGSMEVVPDIGPSVKSTMQSQMEAALDALSRELGKLRTGRATAGMLDHIIVESGGSRTPLNHMAVVSVIDAETLNVMPYDPTVIKDLESAIKSSPLSLNPKLDGDRLIVPIPKLTKDHIKAIVKLINKASEDVKQSIRRSRQKAMDTIKKSGSGMSKDDVKRLEKEVEEMTKKSIKTAEDRCKAKEKEIEG